MQSLKRALGLFFIGFLGLMSCNDPSLIGSDLLEDDQFNIQFTDELKMQAESVFADSVLVYDLDAGFAPLTDFQLGTIQDPFFGQYSSSLYLEFEKNASVATPDFSQIGETLDSAIIILPFNGLSTYGNAFEETIEVEILRLSNTFDKDASFYAEDMIDIDEVLGTFSFVPNADSVVIIVPSAENGLDTVAPHIRIPLPLTFANEIFTAPDSTFSNNDNLQAFFHGLAIRPVGNTNAMIGVQARTGAGIVFYSHRDTTGGVDYSRYSFLTGTNAVKLTTFSHDYEGTVANDFVNQGKAGGDSLLFVHAMQGLDAHVEFTNLNDFQNIVVNKAELIIKIDSLPGDITDIYPAIDQLIINEIDADGKSVLIEDLEILFIRYGSDGLRLFGGELEEDNTYRINFSTHFQRMIDGEVSNKIEIVPYIRGNKASRVVIRGPGNAEGALKLDLHYTKI